MARWDSGLESEVQMEDKFLGVARMGKRGGGQAVSLAGQPAERARVDVTVT
jgi:hypothetical protein